MRSISMVIFFLMICTNVFAQNNNKKNDVQCTTYNTQIESECFCDKRINDIVNHNNKFKCLPKCQSGSERYQLTCRVKCGPDQIRENGVCNSCSGNREWFNGQCLKRCHGDFKRNIENGQCEKSCPNNMELVQNSCVSPCPKNYERVGKACKLNCPPGHVRNGDSCQQDLVCNSDHEIFHNKCLKKCAYNQQRLPNGDCADKLTCNAGQEIVKGKCVQACFTGQERYKGKCEMKCPPSHKRNNQGTCVYCVN